MQRFAQLKAHVFAGPTNANHDFEVYELSWPRQAMRFMFACTDLYKHMCLNSYDSEASKWFYNIAETSQTFLKGLGFASDHLTKSSNANAGSLVRDECFLRKGTFSTLAVIALLSRWAFAPNRRMGGIGKESQVVAKALLYAFWMAPFQALQSGPLFFAIRLVGKLGGPCAKH